MEPQDPEGAAVRGELLAAVAACLATATREGENPHQVQARLTALAALSPETGLELAWRTASSDGRPQYDVLVALPEGGTVCLGFAPDDQQPWALLAAQRWTEGELLAVDDQRMRVNDATALVDFLWKDPDISRRLINTCLLRRELSRDPRVVSEVELAAYVEQWRRTKALFSAHDFETWLDRRGFTLAQFLSRAREQAAMVGLRRRLVGDVAAHFEANRASYDEVEYLRCRLGQRAQAERVQQMIAADTGAFWRLVDDRVLTPEFGVNRRGTLPPDQAVALFTAGPGQVVGPFQGRDGVDLIRVLSTRPAQLDAGTRHSIEESMLEQWLAQARSNARVEWNWGDAET